MCFGPCMPYKLRDLLGKYMQVRTAYSLKDRTTTTCSHQSCMYNVYIVKMSTNMLSIVIPHQQFDAKNVLGNG